MILVLLSCLAPTLPAQAAPTAPAKAATPTDPRPAGWDTAPYRSGGKRIGRFTTVAYEVLDLDLTKGLVAFKLVQSPAADWAEDEGYETGVKCRYAGMENPSAGVTLALFDVNADTLQSFEVYPIVDEKAKCADEASSKATLAAAKEAFSKAGLDITKKPQPVLADEEGDFHLALGDRKVELKAWSWLVGRDQEELWQTWVVDKGLSSEDEAPEDAWDWSMAMLFNGLLQGDKVLFSTSSSFQRTMAGYDNSAWPAVWLQGDKAVFLRLDRAGDMRSSPSEWYSFSQVVSL